MNNKILFRGFRPDENGKTVITVDGEKIRGEWLYWDVLGRIIGRGNWYGPPDGLISQSNVIPETVGQFVKTDKNGKDVVVGDYVKTNRGRRYEVVYNEKLYCYELKNLFDGLVIPLCERALELISNKWECAE